MNRDDVIKRKIYCGCSLPTTASFAEKRFKVIGADKKSRVVDLIRRQARRRYKITLLKR